MSNQNFTPNLSLRFSPQDKARLEKLSRRMRKNQSEVLRVLVRAGLEVMDEADAIENEAGGKIAIKRDVWTEHRMALAGATANEHSDAIEASPAQLRSVGEKIQAADAGDPAMQQWVRRNARWVLAYRDYIKSME
jgi:predicted DNA-binding protein